MNSGGLNLIQDRRSPECDTKRLSRHRRHRRPTKPRLRICARWLRPARSKYRRASTALYEMVDAGLTSLTSSAPIARFTEPTSRSPLRPAEQRCATVPEQKSLKHCAGPDQHSDTRRIRFIATVYKRACVRERIGPSPQQRFERDRRRNTRPAQVAARRTKQRDQLCGFLVSRRLASLRRAPRADLTSHIACEEHLSTVAAVAARHRHLG